MARFEFPGKFLKATSLQTRQRLSETAIALRLYRQEHERYPESLSALVTRYLPSVTIDPFDGKALRYRREEKGFRLWSIGQNRKDDGGMEGLHRWTEDDIVWVAVK